MQKCFYHYRLTSIPTSSLRRFFRGTLTRWAALDCCLFSRHWGVNQSHCHFVYVAPKVSKLTLKCAAVPGESCSPPTRVRISVTAVLLCGGALCQILTHDWNNVGKCHREHKQKDLADDNRLLWSETLPKWHKTDKLKDCCRFNTTFDINRCYSSMCSEGIKRADDEFN